MINRLLVQRQVACPCSNAGSTTLFCRGKSTEKSVGGACRRWRGGRPPLWGMGSSEWWAGRGEEKKYGWRRACREDETGSIHRLIKKEAKWTFINVHIRPLGVNSQKQKVKGTSGRTLRNSTLSVPPTPEGSLSGSYLSGRAALFGRIHQELVEQVDGLRGRVRDNLLQWDGWILLEGDFIIIW